MYEWYLHRLGGLVRASIAMEPGEKHGHFPLLLQLQLDPEARDKIQQGRSEPRDVHGSFMAYIFNWLSGAPWKLLTVILYFQSYWEVCCYYCHGSRYTEKVNSQTYILGVWFPNISYFCSSSNMQSLKKTTHKSIETTWRSTYSVKHLSLYTYTGYQDFF